MSLSRSLHLARTARVRPLAGLAALSVTGLLAAGLAAVAPAEAKPAPGTTTGTGRGVHGQPGAVQRRPELTDQDDAAGAVPASAYATGPLRNLDGSGYLRGRWVDGRVLDRHPGVLLDGQLPLRPARQDQFEQVMGYFWVNQAQEYLQSLGFGSTLPGVLDEPFSVKINQYGGDNSYQTDKPFRIRLGKGGVDDAEDAEVIVHEYGHAVHADQVPGYGQSLDAGAIGESFGDYLAVTVGLAAARQQGWPVRAEEACPMDWDSTSYTAAPHCIRRFDRDLTVADRREPGALRRADLEPGAVGDPQGLRDARPDAAAPGTPR